MVPSLCDEQRGALYCNDDDLFFRLCWERAVPYGGAAGLDVPRCLLSPLLSFVVSITLMLVLSGCASFHHTTQTSKCQPLNGITPLVAPRPHITPPLIPLSNTQPRHIDVQVAQDLIWVWGENGPDAALESALTPARLIPELDDEEGLESGRAQTANIGMSNLAYGWDTLMENLLVREKKI